ncbi:uncharacterized protein CC84DRAFT_1228437 [Paraphaeosphaeria sporulosa]|uniref:Uncharacterized protein n=1 Tax=Paraphaeosphaeria sporulosa TaxID=1460663 RepID=A0A177C3M5_9PLEO|nr:uncharacterized protein CC84DRAFT_1228437 [Paraphaeosphaeria sporulosa]OAG01388.1 hypothetical protein CC84DRAFT_1228437 [Paraphaeosphaeria sporulosa]
MANLLRRLHWFAVVSLVGATVAQTTTSDATTEAPRSSSTEDWTPPTTPPPTHAPFPSASAIPLPTEFSDIPKSIVECWDSLISYGVTRDFLVQQLASGAVYSWSDYDTPTVTTNTYEWPVVSCSTSYPGLTTLCDGYPRANDCYEQCTTIRSSSSTLQFTQTGTGGWLTPTWSTELQQLPIPTCTVAEDLSPECSRLAEAYTWRTSHIDPTASISAPPCAVSLPPTIEPSPPAKARCSMHAESYEAYYWPTPSQSNSEAFCNNGTNPTDTPTIPGRPNTAVVSGLTFTSPYIYHILHNATVYKYAGQSSSVAYGIGSAIYSISSELPKLTFAQATNSILAQSKECHRSNHHGAVHCTISYKPDFAIQDLFTANAKAYYGEELATPTTATICQASYAPTIGLPLGEVASQNRIGEDCEWTFAHSGRTTLLDDNMFSVARFGSNDYHAITTTPGASRSGMTAVASPTPTN